MTNSRKQDLLHRLRAERMHLFQILRELPGIKTKAFLITAKWSVHDVLAHLAGWAVWDLKATREAIKTGHVDISAITDVDAFNAQSVSERSNRTWQQIVDEMEQAQTEWINLLNKLSDEELFNSTRFRSPEWDNLARWVQIAFEHEAEHAQAIQA
ncbi:MAG: ClbS/DfsB family four-helix bundle protein [Candidatus Heimdallarchaeota archaeon]